MPHRKQLLVLSIGQGTLPSGTKHMHTDIRAARALLKPHTTTLLFVAYNRHHCAHHHTR